jgi:hypothetical protein
LHIYTGSVNGRNLVAAPWTPNAALLAADGHIRPEFLWAALDCPGAFAVNFSEEKVLVLGRLTVAISYRPQAAEPCLVIGWPMGSDGRKYFAGTAVFTTDGKLCGAGQATWIQLKPKP